MWREIFLYIKAAGGTATIDSIVVAIGIDRSKVSHIVRRYPCAFNRPNRGENVFIRFTPFNPLFDREAGLSGNKALVWGAVFSGQCDGWTGAGVAASIGLTYPVIKYDLRDARENKVIYDLIDRGEI